MHVSYMPAITLYQCMPAYKPAPTSRLIKSIANNDCKILLDIEDSIQDVENPSLTPGLKIKARKDLFEITCNLPRQKFSLRINSIVGKEFEKDKAILHKVGDHIESVFIPKVESATELILFCNEFKNQFKINLIIETQKGIDNLDKILISPFADNIEFVFFGNYDYHLDTNTYPIAEQNNQSYWNIVTPIISKTEKNNLNFGNSPYVNIADTHGLHYSFDKLLTFCKRDFALMSLHKTQTIFYQSLINKLDSNKLINRRTDHLTHTMDEFRKNKLKGRSFAFDSLKHIITPQEYLLMKQKQNG